MLKKIAQDAKSNDYKNNGKSSKQVLLLTHTNVWCALALSHTLACTLSARTVASQKADRAAVAHTHMHTQLVVYVNVIKARVGFDFVVLLLLTLLPFLYVFLLVFMCMYILYS